MIATRLESLDGTYAVEGRFDLGWIARLSEEQLRLVGLLLERRNNLQRLADDLEVGYNVLRGRLDDIVAAVAQVTPPDPADVLQRLADGEIDPDEADRLLP